MLAGMIDTFGKTVPRPAGLSRLAAGAATALLVASLAGCGDDDSETAGIRPDRPPPNPQKEDPGRPVTWGIQPDAPPPKSPPPAPVQPPAEDAPRK
jgi:hypothetical protein